MKRNKKILLTLGTLASVAAPVAAVVSCGTSLDNGDTSGQSTVRGSEKLFADSKFEYKILPTYTGQADQLLSLGIKPDRYPYQLDKSAPFEYITNPGKYMIGQTDEFKKAFAAKIKALMPADQGTSWWNQQALDAGEKGSDPEYWQHRSGDFTMYEHYLLDDGAKVVDSGIAPAHISGSHTFVQTNFRESRDPFTRMPKNIMEGLLDEPSYVNLSPEEKALVGSMLKAARFVEGVRDAKGDVIPWQTSWDNAKLPADFKLGTQVANPTKLAVDGLPMPSGQPQQSVGDDDENGYSWLYNDYFFAKSYHEDFLDNAEFSGNPAGTGASSVHDWIVNKDGKNTEQVFNPGGSSDTDQQLAKLFFAATYTEHEDELKKVAEAAYGLTAPGVKPPTPAIPHHPIYEQQEEIGGAPMFEGAQRDNTLYFYNTASRLTEAFTDPGKVGDSKADGTKVTQDDINSYQALVKAFHIGQAGFEDPRVKLLKGAQATSETISTQLRERMVKIAGLVSDVKKANGGHLSFGLVTLAPGEGQTTLQTASKYSFLYNELGFDQAMPTDLEKMSKTPDKYVPKKGQESSFFNMDDNGWWWNLGEGAKVLKNTAEFKNIDMGLLTANPTQYANLKTDEKNALYGMFKGGSASTIDTVDYNLWNEGLKTPFVLNMMLDKITDMLSKKTGAVPAHVTAAKAWGTYWTDTFVQGWK